MKRIIFLIMLVAFVASAKADVTRFEAEAGVAAELPLFDYQGGIPKGSAGLEMALRYNFQDSPWDCGVAMQLDCANRNYEGHRDFPVSSRR